MLPDTLREQQFTFARHLRDPDAHAPPPGIEARRLRVYRELFFNNIQGLLAGGFPVIHGILGDARWKTLVQIFYAGYRSHTPLFPRIAAEFVAFIEEHADDDGLPPWLSELAHYEWVEQALLRLQRITLATRTQRRHMMTTTTERAVLAGGCFWGVEEILREVPGVIDTEVGYTGGWLENPTYDDTHDSKSGHAEAIRVTFDPAVLSYEDLLEKWFFKLHDPTTLNRQGNDVGTQYRSAIFPQTPEQGITAERVKMRVEASGKWKQPITTSIEPASTWYSAEAYHQDYLRKHPGGYSCHFMRD